MKKKGYVGLMKQSKSAIDITHGILDLGDFCCIQSRLRTRSLSHDSFFLSEQHQSDSEPPRALSQENVHGKIQALQKRLQSQKMHLGPPPLVMTIKQMDDHQCPTEVQTLSKNLPHKVHLRSSSQGVLPHAINPILPMCHSPPSSPGVDFGTLPQFIPCLDNSAARHRMSIKPRNQRASTKSRRTPTSDRIKSCSESMIILERPLKEDGMIVPKEMPHARTYSSQIIRPGKEFNTPASKCPTSPLKLLKRAEDYAMHAVCQSKEKEDTALKISPDVGSNKILKTNEGTVAKSFNSEGPTSHKGSEDHKESLSSSKHKGVEGSAVLSKYTPHLISLSTQQSHPETEKEHNSMATHAQMNGLNRGRVQDTMQEHHPQSHPLKPLLQHRNASPLDNKYEGRHIHLISLTQQSSGERCLYESTPQQRSLSFSASSDKNHERQRTRSFTGQVGHAGGNKEHVFSLIKPPSNLKTQNLHKNAQFKDTENDTPQSCASEPSDLKIIVSADQDCGDSLANKTCSMITATQEGVEEVNEANKEMKMNTDSEEQKEEMSAYVVKPYTLSQSEVNVKQHTTKVKTSPWLTESTIPTARIQNHSQVGPERETCTVLRSPPLYNSEFFISADCPVSSSVRPQSARMDQEKAGLIRLIDLQASAKSPHTPDNIRSTPVCVTEKNPKQLYIKEPREASTELSWMTMAREKTRSLQQLFTNTFNDFAVLQTVTRPTTSPVTKISSQPGAGPSRAKHQISPVQSSITLLETQLPTDYSSVSGIHPIQPPTRKSTVSPANSSINHSGVDFSLKQTFSPTSVQVQTASFSEKPGQRSTHSNAKPGIYISPTQFNPQTIHAAHQQLSERSMHQANPIQPVLPQSVTKPHVSQSLRLTLNPNLTPHQPVYQLPSPVLQHRPLGENLSALPLGKMEWVSMPQGRPVESQAQYTGGLGSKTILIEQWHHQKPDAIKVVDQKSTPDSQTFNNQSLDDFLTVSNQSRFTELAVSPGPIRLDREVKYQKKTIPPLSPPSSSSPLQSTSESQQPSWMELAKRKSMAWSDKAMD